MHLIYHFMKQRLSGFDYAGVISQLSFLSEDATKKVRQAAIQALSVLAQVADKGRVLELIYELASKATN